MLGWDDLDTYYFFCFAHSINTKRLKCWCVPPALFITRSHPPSWSPSSSEILLLLLLLLLLLYCRYARTNPQPSPVFTIFFHPCSYGCSLYLSVSHDRQLSMYAVSLTHTNTVALLCRPLSAACSHIMYTVWSVLLTMYDTRSATRRCQPTQPANHHGLTFFFFFISLLVQTAGGWDYSPRKFLEKTCSPLILWPHPSILRPVLSPN